MQIEAVTKYTSDTSTVKTPYFLFVGDEKYISTKKDLLEMGLNLVRMSSFCSNDDRLPSVDDLLEKIKMADVNTKDRKMFVIGLGEFLTMSGEKETIRILSRLKDLNVGGAKVILLLRGITPQIIEELQNDPRFDNRRFCTIGNVTSDISFTQINPSTGMPTVKGFKNILSELEIGRSGELTIDTIINLERASLIVKKIPNAHSGIVLHVENFDVPMSCGNDDQWAELLKELLQNNKSLEKVFEINGFGKNIDAENNHDRLFGDDYSDWLFFIALKLNTTSLSNNYLRYVVDKTDNFENFKTNLLNGIIDIPRTDKRFSTFYKERKKLVKGFSGSLIADFVNNNKKDPAESIYRLTDNTRVERKEIISWVSEHGIIKEIASIYPELNDYMKKYVFRDSSLANELTDYFDAYKRQKLSNTIEPEFLIKVDELAKNRKYNRLPTRNEIIEKYEDDGTSLFWIDALGVEYLAFIEKTAQKLGLSITINIARSELPTLTDFNKTFFDEWKGGRKKKEDRLDELKHKKSSKYSYIDNTLPVHLAEELEIIASVLEEAATDLKLRQSERILIASDHGASRLAVIRRKEEKYVVDTKGEHSGRCCKIFQEYIYDLPFAAVENGWIILADYGRFKGSRAADVEVHGGSSLEEVIVPIIALSLRNKNITVQTVKDTIIADFKNGSEIELFFNTAVKDVTVVYNGKPYTATSLDDRHYNVKIPEMKRAGNYSADIYAGSNLIGAVTIKAKSNKVDNSFDELFRRD